ncbi:MAG: beta-propeller fold lactonase family protein [Verrucomicrobiae bacterium]|nr:beta-propeller fold lactonase family protein [Verrucomicrobiae bacterium]
MPFKLPAFPKLLSSILLSGLLFTSGVLAADPEPFLIYAPSRNGEELLIFKLTPNPENKFPYASWELVASEDLHFPGRTIAKHPSKSVFYISGGAKDADGMNLSIKFLNGRSATDGHTVRGYWPRDYSYLSVDRSERFLLGCNYQDGIIDIYRIDEKGMPETKPVTTLEEGRKAAHCVLLSPDNRHFYIPYVKEHNALYQYTFDAATGKVTPLDPKNANPPAGTGPRHLAYHPTLPLLYFSEEQGLGVSVYERNEETGQLTWKASARAAGDDAPKEGVSASDIVMTPDAKFLYTGIRGHEHDYDYLAGYAIGEDGSLTPLGLTETSKIPWGLAVSPDGQHLVVTAFKCAKILVYRIEENGSLKEVASLPAEEGISDVETLPIFPMVP